MIHPTSSQIQTRPQLIFRARSRFHADVSHPRDLDPSQPPRPLPESRRTSDRRTGPTCGRPRRRPPSDGCYASPSITTIRSESTPRLAMQRSVDLWNLDLRSTPRSSDSRASEVFTSDTRGAKPLDLRLRRPPSAHQTSRMDIENRQVRTSDKPFRV